MSTAIQPQIVRRKLIRFSAFRSLFRLSPTHTIHPSFRTRPTIISLFISMLLEAHDAYHYHSCQLSLFATPLRTETTALGHPQTLSHCNVMIPSVCHLSPGQLRMWLAPMDAIWGQFRNCYFDSSFTKAHSAETKAPHFFTWSSHSLNLPDNTYLLTICCPIQHLIDWVSFRKLRTRTSYCFPSSHPSGQLKLSWNSAPLKPICHSMAQEHIASVQTSSSRGSMSSTAHWVVALRRRPVIRKQNGYLNWNSNTFVSNVLFGLSRFILRPQYNIHLFIGPTYRHLLI